MVTGHKDVKEVSRRSEVFSSQEKTAQAPVIKTEQVKPVKPALRNANARMGRHHVRHARHHRSHKHVAGLKAHKYSKATIKHTGSAIKRG